LSALVEQLVFEDVWHGLYGESWKELICDEAFAHPAKFSRALIRRIYDHVIEERWATKGLSVVDPFGGVALGSFDAMRHGLNWYGCELESRFVLLGEQNIALWNERFSRMPNWGTARLLQGDSRKLAEVLSTSTCSVSSPPYILARQDTTRIPPTLGHIYGEAEQDRIAGFSDHRYGESEGQLGVMKEGDLNLAISSPPYSSGEKGHPSLGSVNNDDWGTDGRDITRRRGKTAEYGDAEGDFQAAISSPPYEATRLVDQEQWAGVPRGECHSIPEKLNSYGATTTNRTVEDRETFWSASRLILEQLHQVIVPGGHAVFVTKRFVRDKKIVEFTDQWIQLCEAVGFRLLHHHRASLVERLGTQGGFHEDKEIGVEHKSFFRRLAEAKGSPRIDHESVLCFERA
jgi:hypothetical protein